MTGRLLPRRKPIDVVPRRMLDLCRDLLRVALARIAELEEQLDQRPPPPQPPHPPDTDNGSSP